MKSNDSVITFLQKLLKITEINSENIEKHCWNKSIIDVNLDLIRKKRYAVTDNIWNISEQIAQTVLDSLLDTISDNAHEYKEQTVKMKKMIKDDPSFPKNFIMDVLTNKAKKIYDLARNRHLSNDYITFLAIFTAYPFRKSVAAYINSKINLKDHISGFCPVCGHWPGMSYIFGKEGKKVMACICCGTSWSFRRLQCSFCLTTDHNVLGYLNIENEKEISSYVCDKCRRYLKTIRIEQDDFVCEEATAVIDYMTSGDMDIASVQNKYLQESLLTTKFDGPNDKHIEMYIKKLS